MRRDNHKQLEKGRTTGPDEEQESNVQNARDCDWREPTTSPTKRANSTKSIPTIERWEAFIADDDERDPQPEYGDFWPNE